MKKRFESYLEKYSYFSKANINLFKTIDKSSMVENKIWFQKRKKAQFCDNVIY